jgi:hypothetical protein
MKGSTMMTEEVVVREVTTSNHTNQITKDLQMYLTQERMSIQAVIQDQATIQPKIEEALKSLPTEGMLTTIIGSHTTHTTTQKGGKEVTTKESGMVNLEGVEVEALIRTEEYLPLDDHQRSKKRERLRSNDN